MRYAESVRNYALLHLLIGWAIVFGPLSAVVHFLPTDWFGSILVGGVAGLALLASPFGTYFLLRRSLLPSQDDAEKHLLCSLGSVLPAMALLLFVAGPLVTAAAAALGVRIDDSWHGIPEIAYGIILAFALVGPLQYLWREAKWAARSTAILLLAGTPLAVALVPNFAANVRSTILFILGFLLVAFALAIVEFSRNALELANELRSPLIQPEGEFTTVYKEHSGRRVGIALSGGGYRASLFTLGALIYVHDSVPHRAAEPRRLLTITSVSGGSITNAVIAHGIKLGDDPTDKLDQLGRVLVRHVVSTGSMFRGREATFYYIVLLPLAIALGLTFGWILIRDITWSAFWRSVAIPAIGVSLVAAWGLAIGWVDRIKSSWLEPIAMLAASAAGFVAVGAFLNFILTDPEWRLALTWLAGGFVVLTATIAAYALRGRLIQLNFDGLLQQVSTSQLLRDVHPDPHHIFCATEVQFGETAYLARDIIWGPSFSFAGPGRLKTAVAVRASAALPVAFPPVILGGFTKVFGVLDGIAERDRRRERDKT
jgi:hypothetical protein